MGDWQSAKKHLGEDAPLLLVPKTHSRSGHPPTSRRDVSRVVAFGVRVCEMKLRCTRTATRAYTPRDEQIPPPPVEKLRVTYHSSRLRVPNRREWLHEHTRGLEMTGGRGVSRPCAELGNSQREANFRGIEKIDACCMGKQSKQFVTHAQTSIEFHRNDASPQ